MISVLRDDGIHFTNEAYAGLLAAFSVQFDEGKPYNQQEFLQELEPQIKNTAIHLLTPPYELADWAAHQVEVREERTVLHKAVIDPIMYIKKKQLGKMREELLQQLIARIEAELPYDELLEDFNRLNQLQGQLNRYTNTVIQK